MFGVDEGLTDPGRPTGRPPSFTFQGFGAGPGSAESRPPGPTSGAPLPLTFLLRYPA